MSNNFKTNKLSHMNQYYRKQSDQKMINSIIHMKSSLSDNFSLQKYQKINSLNKSKRQMTQTIQKHKIYQQNKKLVYRIKQTRQKTSRDNQKYLDHSYNQWLTNTRNSFRQKVKDDKQIKVTTQNKRMLKRLINTKSSYSFRSSTSEITSNKSSNKNLSIKKYSKCIDYKDLNEIIKNSDYLCEMEEQLQNIPKNKNKAKYSNLNRSLYLDELTNLNENEQNRFNKACKISKRAKTQFVENNFKIRNINEIDRSKIKINNVSNPQKKQLQSVKINEKKNNHKIQIQKDLNKLQIQPVMKIPLKSREIKLQLIHNNKNQKLKNLPQYSRNIKQSIQAKGAWGNSWLKSYRIVV